MYRGLRETFELVALDKPDIAVVSEGFNLGACSDWAKVGDPVPGPVTDVFGEIARKYRMYLWCPMIVRQGKRRYNAAVLLDRRGEVVGAYHKMYPTSGELDAGILPGRKVRTFETDFGRVGACICFDAHFHEVGHTLAREGAEIVFFPSMFVAHRCLMSWAVEFGYFVVTSCGNWSFIMDNLGRIVNETGSRFDSVSMGHIPPIASAVLNLDTVVLHHDRNQEKVKEIKRKYGAGVQFEYEQHESMIAMSSHMKDTTAEDIVREFKLLKRQEYFDQSRAACNRLRRK
jgi:predicted amidohydrolase